MRFTVPGDEPEACRCMGDVAFGILFTTDPGSKTNDSAPAALLALVPSLLEVGVVLFRAFAALGLGVEEEGARRPIGEVGDEEAGESLIESSPRERRFAASHAAFAMGDAFILARR